MQKGQLTVSHDQLPVDGKWKKYGVFIPSHSYPVIPIPIPILIKLAYRFPSQGNSMGPMRATGIPNIDSSLTGTAQAYM